mmetsp:Transcript_16918/g.46598  ORF Transcript_16918/g.46598 Transcript_16918/m.46598 type:complete len:219 (+) Transcript_16918:273-929(+)
MADCALISDAASSCARADCASTTSVTMESELIARTIRGLSGSLGCLDRLKVSPTMSERLSSGIESRVALAAMHRITCGSFCSHASFSSSMCVWWWSLSLSSWCRFAFSSCWTCSCSRFNSCSLALASSSAVCFLRRADASSASFRIPRMKSRPATAHPQSSVIPSLTDCAPSSSSLSRSASCFSFSRVSNVLLEAKHRDKRTGPRVSAWAALAAVATL